MQAFFLNEPIHNGLIDVLADPPVSNRSAEILSVSTNVQVILVEAGAPVWHTSHSHITAEALKAQLDGI